MNDTVLTQASPTESQDTAASTPDFRCDRFTWTQDAVSQYILIEYKRSFWTTLLLLAFFIFVCVFCDIDLLTLIVTGLLLPEYAFIFLKFRLDVKKIYKTICYQNNGEESSVSVAFYPDRMTVTNLRTLNTHSFGYADIKSLTRCESLYVMELRYRLKNTFPADLAGTVNDSFEKYIFTKAPQLHGRVPNISVYRYATLTIFGVCVLMYVLKWVFFLL